MMSSYICLYGLSDNARNILIAFDPKYDGLELRRRCISITTTSKAVASPSCNFQQKKRII